MSYYFFELFLTTSLLFSHVSITIIFIGYPRSNVEELFYPCLSYFLSLWFFGFTFLVMFSLLTSNHLIDFFILDDLWWLISKLFLLWLWCSFLILFYEYNIYSYLTEDIIYNLFEIFSAFALFLFLHLLLLLFFLQLFILFFHVGGRFSRKGLT